MKLQRLRRMGLAEFVGRTRMEASKLWDRVAANGARRRPLWSAVECRQRLDAFRQAAPSRFFAGAGDERMPALLADRASDAVGEVIAGAEWTMAGRFDLLGYRGLSFGDPVDWHLDPVSQRRAPLVHWGRLDPLDAAIGDSKVVWELNRHQWLVELGQAYRTTGDERYGEMFVTHVGNWLDANPVGQGINWASSLEIALRLMAWCWALVLFRRSPALSPELFARMSASIEEHAAHVERYLSYYFSPNTHLTGEALGLFYAGTMFPEMAQASRWRERGAQILIAESSRHVLPDGVYFEQSTCYQRYTVEIALHFLILGARSGFRIPAVMGERVQSMLDFLLTVRSPGGPAPQIGDSDGGWLLPLSRRSPSDLRGVFGPAAALFGRPDYAWAAGGVVPELLWLLGPTGLATFESLRPEPPPGAPSRLFDGGGYAVMRDGWGAEGHHLVFDVGPLGCPDSGGHGHADL
ncbi:MAG TPA: heparinase II/III family protein, partial [Gemmatimonadales bacterium]|nr:heparinase II/III family protein [Gemmatimonadales bacterium]